MFFPVTQAGRRVRAVLAVGALAGLVALAGCSGRPASTGTAPADQTAPAESSWAGALGSGVTIDPPGSAPPGNDSPQGVMIGVARDYSTSQWADLCTYDRPSRRPGCLSSWRGSPSPGNDVDLADFPIGTNVRIGYTAIDGDEALTGFTGMVCVLKDDPACYANHNPAAILDTGKSFRQLWAQAHQPPVMGNIYALSPAVKSNGKWYSTADTF